MLMSNQVLRLALALLVLTITAPRSDARELTWGVNGHPFTNYRGTTIVEELDFIKQMGLTSYRVDVLDERSVRGLRLLAREGRSRGITILPVITPSVSFTANTPEELYKRAFDRAVALVEPLKDEIRVWELGNELENHAIIRPCEMRDNGERYNCAWGPAGGTTALDYYGPRWAKVSAILRGLSDGVKSVDPTIRRAIGTAGWGHTGAFERMKADGLDWEISIWHMYGQDPEWAFKILAGYGKPIWVTEFNHPGGSTDGEQAQAGGIVRQMTRLRELAARYNVEAAHIYELMDEPYWAPSYEAVMGLVTLESAGKDAWKVGKPKPAFHAVQAFIAGKQQAGSGDPSKAEPGLPPRVCELATSAVSDPSLPPRVDYAYCLILGRQADGGGRSEWIASLEKRTPIADMLVAMMTSHEGDVRYAASKLDNAQFVSLLYRLLLLREPDGGGLKEYVGALDGNQRNRAETVRMFVQSYEFAVRHPVLSAPLSPSSQSSQ